MSKRSLFPLKALLLLGAIWLLVTGLPFSSAGMNLKPSATASGRYDSSVEPLAGIWSAPANISNSEGEESRAPSLAVDSAGVVHVVWEEGRYLYHSYCQSETWSVKRRVATGEQPAIAVDRNNVMHLVFMNEFRGNYEIYYCQWAGSSWSLPRNVSSTSGVSANPDIAIDSHNTVYVTWTDNSPGYPSSTMASGMALFGSTAPSRMDVAKCPRSPLAAMI